MVQLLVVENARPVQRLLAWALQQENYEVAVVSPRESAGHPADVLVINARLSPEERRSMIDAARRRGTPVLALLPEGTPEGSGADAEISSPYRAADIVTVIERLRPK